MGLSWAQHGTAGGVAVGGGGRHAVGGRVPSGPGGIVSAQRLVSVAGPAAHE